MGLQRIVVLSGPIGGGKSSVAAELLAAFGYDRISSSGFLRERIGTSLPSDHERTALQNAGDKLDQETDYRWVVDQVALPTVATNPGKTLWLFDAARKPRQIEHFRRAFGTALLHCHISADETILKTRYAQRATGADTPYELAVSHINEVTARSLKDIADHTFQTDQESASDIARRIASL